MKILVTGSNGLLGQKLTDACQQHSTIELIATGKGIDRHQPQGGYIYETLDITNQEEVMSILLKHKPEVVINTAAMTNVDQCESDHQGCDDLNIHAVRYLAEACNTLNAHFIHVSTDFVFSGETGPLDETAIPAPISYYGGAKLKGEEVVKEISNDWTIVRAILVYGVVHDMSRSNFVLWTKSNLEQHKKINVVDDQFRTPTLAEDLALGCLSIAKQHASGIFHLGGPAFGSVYEFVVQAAKFWELDQSLIHRVKSAAIAQPAKRPPITGFIIDKAKQTLNYHPRTFTEGLKVMDDQLKKLS